jgi:hypothetical protein
MTPAELNVQIKGYTGQLKLRSEDANVHAWLIGTYVRIAVASTLVSKVDYPEIPYGTKQEDAAEPWQVTKMKMADYAVTVEKSLE